MFSINKCTCAVGESESDRQTNKQISSYVDGKVFRNGSCNNRFESVSPTPSPRVSNYHSLLQLSRIVEAQEVFMAVRDEIRVRMNDFAGFFNLTYGFCTGSDK